MLFLVVIVVSNFSDELSYMLKLPSLRCVDHFLTIALACEPYSLD